MMHAIKGIQMWSNGRFVLVDTPRRHQCANTGSPRSLLSLAEKFKKEMLLQKMREEEAEKKEKEDKQNAILMLEQSIENGWKGVFDIKDKKKPTPIDQAMYNLKNNVNEQLNDINF